MGHRWRENYSVTASRCAVAAFPRPGLVTSARFNIRPMRSNWSSTSVSARWTGCAISVVAALLAAWATLLPSAQTVSWSPWCIACGDLSTVDLTLNFAMLMPLGFGLALAGLSVRGALVACSLASLGIELLQVAVVAGRDASVGDLVTNSLGGIVGAWLGRRPAALLMPSAAPALRLIIGWGLVVLGVQSIAVFSFAPAPTRVPYHGQIGRALGGRPPYPGTIIDVSVEGIPIPDTYFDGRAVYAALAQQGGAGINVTLAPPGNPTWVSSVARIVDARRREILLVGQDGTDALIVVRTGAAALRLRPIRVRLTDAFPAPAQHDDTLHLTGRYGAADVTLATTSRTGAPRLHVRLTPGHAWRLMSPFRADVSGSVGDTLLGSLWIFGLLFPLGYWVRFAQGLAPTLNGHRAGNAIAVSGLTIIATLVAAPVAAGTHIAAVNEWAGALAAIIAGWTTGWLVSFVRGGSGDRSAWTSSD